MIKENRNILMYGYALLAPLAATLFAYLVEAIMPKGNISIVYLTAVLLVAVQTHTKPALVGAIGCFLAYNFFFTQPEFSLVMIHKEEILTVFFFLMIAAVTGQLTSRLREKHDVLKNRESINQLQSTFSEKLTQSINDNEVIQALYDFLLEATCENVMVINSENGNLKISYGDGGLTPAEINAVNKVIELGKPAGKYTAILSNTDYYFCPLIINRSKATVLAIQFKKDPISVNDKINLSALLIHQATLALTRIYLTIELEQERIQKEQELLRSALLSSVSHDLKTPLSAMIGATTTLIELDKSINKTQQIELLESILEESQRLDSYIQNLLDMTRLGHGELSLNRDWVSLDDILNVVLKRIRKTDRKIHVNLQLNRNIPLLWVHAALIEQALFNILDNAIKFSPDESVIDIQAGKSDDGKTISVYVIDNGPGIPEEEQDRIFDMFHTLCRGDKHTSGAGLGLTISKGIINAHGGDISVINDETHKGTIFHILLPITGS